MRMKRWLALLLTVLLTFSCSALAEAMIGGTTDAVSSTDDDMSSVYLNGFVQLDGKVYGYNGSSLYELDLEQPGQFAAVYALNLPERERSTEDGAMYFTNFVSAMTSDGTTLYALTNSLGEVHAVTLAEDGTASFGEALAVCPNVEEDSYLDVQGFTCINDTFYVLLPVDGSTWGKNNLWELKPGAEPRQVASGAYLSVQRYKDDMLLTCYWDQDTAYQSEEIVMPMVRQLDPQTGEMVDLLATTDTQMQRFCYDETSDILYFPTEDRLYRSVSLGALEPCAYLNLQYVPSGLLAYDGFFYIYDDNNTAWVWTRSDTDPAKMPANPLRIATYFRDDIMTAFANEHPEIPVITTDSSFSAEDVTQSMISSSDAADIYAVDMNWGVFDALLKKGYCVDLSSSQVLMDAVQRMNPEFTKSFFVDGKLYAFPYSVNAQGLGYSPSVLEALGLTEDDLPKTYLEFLDFCVTWVDDYADEYADLSLFEYVYNVRTMLFTDLMDRYMDYSYVSGENMSFDTPLMRKLLAKLEEVLPQLKTLEDDSSDNMVFFSSDGPTALFDLYVDPIPQEYVSYDYKPLLLPLDEGLDVAANMSMRVYLVNPNSKNQEAAVTFLEYLAQHMDASMKIALCPDENTPIEDPYTEKYIQQTQDTLAQLRQQREEAADADKRSFDEMIADQESTLTMLEQQKYRISAEQIAAYRAVEPYLHVVSNTLYSTLAGDSSNAMQRYVDGEMSTEQFIRECDRILRMIQLENQ